MIEELKQLKDIYDVIKNAIDKIREPKQELITVSLFLDTLAKDPSILASKVDKDFRRYFQEDFTQGLLKRLIREKSNDEKYLEVIAFIFESYLELFIQGLKDENLPLPFIESMKTLFEYDNLLHSYNYNISDYQLREIKLKGQTWRSNIKAGDMIDVLQDEYKSYSGWTQVRVDQIEGDMLYLQFIHDYPTADRRVDRNSMDLAPFQSKTKASYEFKDKLEVGMIVDGNDNNMWNKSTILEIQDKLVAPERSIKLALLGFRIYTEKGTRQDEKGSYEGYSNKYDEWVPLYSPKILPIYTKTGRSYYEENIDVDDEFDDLFPKEEGHEQVFAVPRIRKCTSRLFMHLMNKLGNMGGFNLILATIKKLSDQQLSQEELNTVCTLVEMVSKPYLIYHRDFQKKYFPLIIQDAKKCIMNAPDKSLRDMQRDKVGDMIKAIDNMQKRNLSKEERDKESEIFKLDICLLCLRSGYLERRIQGIKDLNSLIKNNRVMSSKSITNQALINWLKENDVFSVIFDPKKTHLQIVQRTNDILKLLLQENELSLQLFETFWNLSKSDYKVEVYKILNDISYYLKRENFDFILSQLVGNQGSADKISIDDYQCLSEMAKQAKDDDFKANVNKFFWDMIIKSDQHKQGQLIVTALNFIRTNKIQIYRNYAAAAQAQSVEVASQSLYPNDFEKVIIESVINNLAVYCQQANEGVDENPSILHEQRKKMFFNNHKYSHHDEIDERLSFIKYVANFSYDLKITKQDLGKIYDLLVSHSKIQSDQEEFLIWCKSLCESSSIQKQILDLNEVGEFFTEKMKSKELDVKTLPIVGFEFLQHYFLSVNEKSSKVLKSSGKGSKQSKFVSNYNFNNYGSMPYSKNLKEDTEPIFKLMVEPEQLEQLDIVWNVALHCENPKVVEKAIHFLMRVYYQLDEDLNSKKIDIQNALIAKCMDILGSTKEEFALNRVIEVIKHIIYEAEKKGTGDVQPHNAVLKGELLERIQIKNRSASKKNSVLMSIYSNTTVWEFKKEVAKQFELSPKYMRLERSNGQVLKDLDNGKTLAELGIQSYEMLYAQKLIVEEEVANAPLIGPNQKLTEKAIQIFTEWFGLYSNDQGEMTKETCAQFIKGCTNELPSVNDDRIVGVFNNYDTNKDGKLDLNDFLLFYENACKSKPETVRENLKAHHVRPDLKKLSEVQEDSSFSKNDMPRFTISENQHYFDRLMDLLDRDDSVSQSSWDLIQMLATNRQIYRRVLQLKTAIDEQSGKIDWSKLFDSQSIYKLLYTLQIIEAVMEEGEGSNLERIVVIQEEEQNKKQNIPAAPSLPGSDITPTPTPGEEQQIDTNTENKQVHFKKSNSIVHDEEDQNLKQAWTSMFLQNDGIHYILKVFMEKEIGVQSNQDKSNFNQIFELKHIAFLLKLLRIFIMAAFSTSKESQVYQVANMVRRSSSIQEDKESPLEESPGKLKKENQQTEGSRFKELQTLLEGPLGESIIEQIDYKVLQQKILRVISQVLSKKEMIFEDKLIIENALSLWVGCVLHRNELFNEFYNFKGDIQNCDQFILTGILYCPYEKVREEFKLSLSSIALKLSGSASKGLQVNPLRYLLKLLSENITQISNYHSKQYFDLFCVIIEYYFMLKSIGSHDDASFNPEQLLSHVIDKIKEYNQMGIELNEKENAQDDEGEDQGAAEIENVYVGLIQLTSKIIDNFEISQTAQIVEQKSLIEEIFVKFLFASVFKDNKNQQKEIKIQPKKQRKTQKKQTFGKKSKDAAYKLINGLIRKSPLLMHNFLERSLIPLMNSIRRLDIWNYSPTGSSGSGSSYGGDKQKYVGLRNLGMCCYMNSMLQQFFMIPGFRYNLLCVDDHTPEDMKEYKGNMVDDNMLHQLQKLMAHLELSERSEYNPFEFCFSFKEMDGQPTNIGEQKDAQEFLNLLFDRVETMLKNTSRKYLLQSVFGGQTCSQLVCQECGKVKNRIEDFYNLSLTVKDIKSVYESLQKMIEGEVINDFSCEGCNKKVDISKRSLISQTPNVLIIHLQRIVFNFDTFKNDKLNSFFEFPYQLDLKPYSFYEVMKKEKRLKGNKEGDEEDQEQEVQQPQVQDEDSKLPEEDDCFEYKLVGATVHSGTANSGHYWSYINTRRGYLEPDESDPNWNKTENEQWMEYNDSRVSDFNFDKLKDECFGDQNKNSSGMGGDEGGWSSGWSSYGKSAYMLVYERKKKKPIKIVLTEEEANAEKMKGNKVMHDEAKNEHYKLIDYREGVEETAPNKIYKQVSEDNKKFEFDNDIYSQEFFDFIKSILYAGQSLAQDKNDKSGLMQSVFKELIQVGKKSILEILSRCYYNQQIKNLVEVMIELMKSNDELSLIFMNQCYLEDNFEYLFLVMLECPDAITRLNVTNLVKFILSQLKEKEKNILYDVTREEVEYRNADGTTFRRIQETPVAMTTKFIMKILDNLNTLIAKSWSRFEYFLELLTVFAIGDPEYTKNLTEAEKADQERTGLEFLFKQQFIGKACDFMLGRKSPLSTPNEKRFEMGGSYSSPNFSPILKIITKMINHSDLVQQYPLQDIEKKLLLQFDLLKIMLKQASGGKQFGLCLANLCRNNIKYSKKVSKIFIKVINASSFDDVKNYLKALKPFLKMEDSLKQQKLEWIFGFPQIIAKKEYRDPNFKFGLEHVQKINEECYTYISPITNMHGEEALLTQLLKCKGRQDTFAINCLKEMLSLMAKDDLIARFIYNTAPPSYQYGRYIDWIKPYLESQRSDLERSSSYQYMKQKYDSVVKALNLYTLFQIKVDQYTQEEKEAFEKTRESKDKFIGSEEDYMAYSHPDVINYYPPQLIIGKQVGIENEIKVVTDHPMVKVTLSELTNEYNYSNPTQFFNLSLPHVEFKTNMYQTMTYSYFKKTMFQNEANARKLQRESEERKRKEESIKEEERTNEEEEVKNPQEELKEEVKYEEEVMPELRVRDWYENRKEGQVLMRLTVSNRFSDTIKFRVTLRAAEGSNKNIILPVSFLNDSLYQNEYKYIAYFQKIDPSQPWPEIDVQVEAHKKSYGYNGGPSSNMMGSTGDSIKINIYDQSGSLTMVEQADVNMNPARTISCLKCKAEQSASNFKCVECGDFLSSGQTFDPQEISSSLYTNYY